jgi:hypothetical protein
MSVDKARDYFNQKKVAYNPVEDKGSAEEFRELANGV